MQWAPLVAWALVWDPALLILGSAKIVARPLCPLALLFVPHCGSLTLMLLSCLLGAWCCAAISSGLGLLGLLFHPAASISNPSKKLVSPNSLASLPWGDTTSAPDVGPGVRSALFGRLGILFGLGNSGVSSCNGTSVPEYSSFVTTGNGAGRSGRVAMAMWLLAIGLCVTVVTAS